LKHPNIVTIHDSGTAATGHVFFVMDYISGQPLDQWISDCRLPIANLKERRLSPSIGNRKSEIDNLLRLFQTICEAVNAAHLRGVIHRDLKPGNIRVDSSGEPHILDFGLAKVATPFEIGNLN
jgi:serine/threonine-protein kinase